MLRSVKIVGVGLTALVGAPTAAYAIPIDGFASHDRSITLAAIGPVLGLGSDAAANAKDTSAAQPSPLKKLTRYERKLRSARKSYLSHYRNAKRHHGVSAVGRNIGRWGVIDHGKVRDAKVAELRESDARLASMLGLVTTAASTGSAGAPSVPSGASMPPAYIAECESGGDPTAVSSDGKYRGKWQMDQGTWESAGGAGDPAAASEATQDAVAARLFAMRGTQPWGCA
jgi:hypothetical protein